MNITSWRSGAGIKLNTNKPFYWKRNAYKRPNKTVELFNLAEIWRRVYKCNCMCCWSGAGIRSVTVPNHPVIYRLFIESRNSFCFSALELYCPRRGIKRDVKPSVITQHGLRVRIRGLSCLGFTLSSILYIQSPSNKLKKIYMCLFKFYFCNISFNIKIQCVAIVYHF